MQKDVFWKAGIITLVIFIIGIGLGIWIENSRTEEIKTSITEMDVQWNDARLQNLYYQYSNKTNNFCNSAIEANFLFSDKVYEEGKKIEYYESSGMLTDSLLQEKKRYALLQLQFWLNSIYLRKVCDADYITLLYFYSHYDESLKPIQKVESIVLMELKEKYGRQLLLVPLPMDLDINTIEMLKIQYNITKAPAILINEKVKFEGLTSKDKIEDVIKSLLNSERYFSMNKTNKLLIQIH